MAKAGSADDTWLRVQRPTATLRELAIAKLREAILGLRFAPGERLVERRLGESLGVSRTIVREVLSHLEAEGLVETLPHQGPVVARLDAATADQIYEMRLLIEAMAARECARHVDEVGLATLEDALDGIRSAFEARDLAQVIAHTTRFYEALFLGAGKPVAWEITRKLNARINHLRAMTLGSPGRERTGPAEMQRILEAVRARDAGAAEAAAREHVGRAGAIARERLAMSAA